MSKLFLHIGTAKTGTTAIQHALSFNVTRLDCAGIIYPRLPGITLEYGLIDHNRLAYALFDKRPGVDIESTREKFSALAETGKTVLLSAEVFYMRPFEYDFPDHESYIRFKCDSISQTKELLSVFDEIKVICYVRRQDLWFESMYNELVKQWKHDGKSFTEYLSRVREQHYSEQLDLWESVFGPGNIIVRPFEKSQLKNGDIISDFCAQLGLDATALTSVPVNLSTVNPRLSRDVLEFQKIVYKLKLDSAERRLWQKTLWQVSEEMLKIRAEPDSWNRFLSAEDRQRLLGRFADANSYVARKYLARADGNLFIEPVDTTGEMYPGLQTEKAVEIWFRLDSKLNSAVVIMELWLHKIRNWVRHKFPLLRPVLSPIGRCYQKFMQGRRFGYE